MVVTNQRVYFTTLEGETLDGGSLEYGEIATIDAEQAASDRLEITAIDGTGWQFSLPDTDPAATVPIEVHLRWIGGLRRRLLRVRNDIELTAGRIREHVDVMEWDTARKEYQRARDDLDRLITAVQLTTPIDDPILAPRLTDIERTLEEAHVRLCIEQAHSELDLATYHIENQEYDRAGELLCRAQKYYERARTQRTAVKRADDFLFGTQRELVDDIESLGWELETVAAEPVRLANEARIRAQESADPAEALEHWETAFELYGTILTLDRESPGLSFTEDPEHTQDNRAVAAERVVDLASELARTQWNEGADRQQAGEMRVALEYCRTAHSHLERAHEVAMEFDPHRALEFGPRLDTMVGTIAKLVRAIETSESEPAGQHITETDEHSVTEDEGETVSSAKDEGETAVPPKDETETASSAKGETDEMSPASDKTATEASTHRKRDGLPSVTDLLNMDTHHEITLELDGIDMRPATRKQTDDESTNGTASTSELTGDEEDGRTDGGLLESGTVEVETDDSATETPSNSTD